MLKPRHLGDSGEWDFSSMKQSVTSDQVPESRYPFPPGKKQRGLSQVALNSHTSHIITLDFKMCVKYICCLQTTQSMPEPAKPRAQPQIFKFLSRNIHHYIVFMADGGSAWLRRNPETGRLLLLLYSTWFWTSLIKGFSPPKGVPLGLWHWCSSGAWDVQKISGHGVDKLGGPVGRLYSRARRLLTGGYSPGQAPQD